jgi:hypothetical protein
MRYRCGGIARALAISQILTSVLARSNGLYSVQREKLNCPRPALTSWSINHDAIGSEEYQGQRVSFE